MATHATLVTLLCICVFAKTVALQITSSCDAGWATFGKSAFVRTAYNNPTLFESFEGYSDHEFGLQGLFVHPESRLAVCLMEKNGCSMMTELMNMIFTENFTAGINYQVSKASQEKYGWTGIDNVFNDPQAVRAVFVRDPLSRFVSAFLNKCLKGEENCPAYKGGGIVFRDAVEWAVNATDLEDMHWRPQALHCQLQHRLHQYSVIGLMTKKTFAQDVSCVLNKAGFSNVTSNYFETHKKPANPTPLSFLTEEDILKRFFTPTAARRLISRLHEDYDLFGFETEPRWIANATGEWYERKPAVYAALNSKADVTHDVEDDDDVFTLAWRAGFMDLP